MSDSEEDLKKKWKDKLSNKKKGGKGKKPNKKDPQSTKNEENEINENKEDLGNKEESKETVTAENNPIESETPEGNILEERKEEDNNENRYMENRDSNYEPYDYENNFTNEENRQNNNPNQDENYDDRNQEVDLRDSQQENPPVNEADMKLFQYIEKEDYDNFFQFLRDLIDENPNNLTTYKDFLIQFYNFLTKITIKTSSQVKKNNLSDPKFIDIKVLQQNNKGKIKFN